jgi:hypothetical protein
MRSQCILLCVYVAVVITLCCVIPNIQAFQCFGIEATSITSVCNSHGTCIQQDRCLCASNYYGTKCEDYVVNHKRYFFPGGGNTIYSITQNEATTMCSDIASQLPVLLSKEDNDALYKYIELTGDVTRNYWIGLIGAWVPGNDEELLTFQWVTGDITSEFENWVSSDGPYIDDANYYDGVCVEMCRNNPDVSKNSHWNNTFCAESKNVVCQQDGIVSYCSGMISSDPDVCSGMYIVYFDVSCCD